MIKTTINKIWICDACGWHQTETREVINQELVYTDVTIDLPKGWKTVHISRPLSVNAERPLEALLCLICCDKVQQSATGTFKQALSVYSKMFQTDRPILTVDAIVVKDDKFLLIKRKNPPYGWAFPGGLVDHNETVETAVVRELREETCLEAGNIKFFDIVSDPARDPRFHAVSVVYVIQEFYGEAMAADDAKEIGWFSFDDILDMDRKGEIAFDHMDIIKKYMENP